MPLVRIDVPASTSAADRRAAADVVHDALVATFNVPLADRFQLIAEHRDGELICTPEYLGVPHSANVVFVQITCSEGRSVATKRALYERIAGEMPKRSGFSADDVIINLVETRKENWSFGRGLAPYADA
jgi:phenylpyruvate tautomerase PptA (4-oxalocrotonate tautomerase family)